MEDVLIGAGHEVDRAAEQGLERLRPAFEIDDRDVEPVSPEIAAALGQSDWKVIKVRLVGDAKPERRPFKLLGAAHPRKGRAQSQTGQAARKCSAIAVHAAFSPSVLPAADAPTALACPVAFTCMPTSPSREFFSSFDICCEMRFWTAICPEARDATPLENSHVSTDRDMSAILARCGSALPRHCGPPVLRRLRRCQGGQNQPIPPEEISGHVPRADNREIASPIPGPVRRGV